MTQSRSVEQTLLAFCNIQYEKYNAELEAALAINHSNRMLVDKINARQKELKKEHEEKIKQIEIGCCFGLGLTYAVMKEGGKLEWWAALLQEITNWDGQPASLATKIILPDRKPLPILEKHKNTPFIQKQDTMEMLLEKALNFIIHTHSGNTRFKAKTMNQRSILNPEGFVSEEKPGHKESFLKSLDNHPVKHYHQIAGYFSKEQLLKILEEKQCEDTIILVGNGSHGINFGYDGTAWTVYDPRYDHSKPKDGKYKIIHKTGTKEECIDEVFKLLGPSLWFGFASFDPNKNFIFQAYEDIEKTDVSVLFHGNGMLLWARHFPEKLIQELNNAKNDFSLRERILSKCKYSFSSKFCMDGSNGFYSLIHSDRQILPLIFELARDSSHYDTMRFRIMLDIQGFVNSMEPLMDLAPENFLKLFNFLYGNYYMDKYAVHMLFRTDKNGNNIWSLMDRYPLINQENTLNFFLKKMTGTDKDFYATMPSIKQFTSFWILLKTFILNKQDDVFSDFVSIISDLLVDPQWSSNKLIVTHALEALDLSIENKKEEEKRVLFNVLGEKALEQMKSIRTFPVASKSNLVEALSKLPPHGSPLFKLIPDEILYLRDTYDGNFHRISSCLTQEQKNSDKLSNFSPEMLRSLMFLLIYKNRSDLARELLRQTPTFNLNVPYNWDENENSYLHLCMKMSNPDPELVKMLSPNFDWTYQNKEGNSIFLIAIENGHYQLIEEMLRHNLMAKDIKISSPIWRAILQLPIDTSRYFGMKKSIMNILNENSNNMSVIMKYSPANFLTMLQFLFKDQLHDDDEINILFSLLVKNNTDGKNIMSLIDGIDRAFQKDILNFLLKEMTGIDKDFYDEIDKEISSVEKLSFSECLLHIFIHGKNINPIKKDQLLNIFVSKINETNKMTLKIHVDQVQFDSILPKLIENKQYQVIDLYLAQNPNLKNCHSMRARIRFFGKLSEVVTKDQMAEALHNISKEDINKINFQVFLQVYLNFSEEKNRFNSPFSTYDKPYKNDPIANKLLEVVKNGTVMTWNVDELDALTHQKPLLIEIVDKFSSLHELTSLKALLAQHRKYPPI